MEAPISRGLASPLDGPARSWERSALVDSVLSEQRRGWRSGEPLSVESYLDRHPTLRDDADGILDLADNEIALREEAGQTPRLDEYLERFPHLDTGLRALFEVHPALRGGESAAGQSTLASDWRDPRVGSASTAPDPTPTPAGSPAALRDEATGWPVIAGFDILGELGHGGMGVVYRAHDRHRNEVVALKMVQRMDPSALYRFKQEFRLLADVHHPNLVTLNRLSCDGRHWFFTMELIDGWNFLTYVRSRPDLAADDPDQGPDVRALQVTDGCLEEEEADSTITQLEPLRDVGRARTGPSAPRPALSASRAGCLRKALAQLAAGVEALHEAGKLHRDIKPNNVLVTRRGRVVLLDFGLAAELDPSGLHVDTEPHVLGTVAYMAPEQAAGQAVSPASDWYSVGVILFEVLTGRHPFQGGPLDVLLDKQRLDPPAPRDLVGDVPEDLDRLCVELLRRRPEDRPSGRDVLRRLGGVEGEFASSTLPTAPAMAAPLIGRVRHLEALSDGFTAMTQGRTVAVFVHGRSGAGKSTLVRHFLDGLVEREEALVLSGRCYEREAVPYKALDSLIDGLSRYLRRLPTLEAQALLPRDISLLAQVFPVLRHADAVATAPRRPLELADPQELRNRASHALYELLARLGDRGPLILAIDDLQWGDIDSAAMLSDLLRHADPARLLLVGSYRSEDAGSSPFLNALLAPPTDAGSRLDVRTLAVDELAPSEAQELALGLLGRDGPAAGAVAGAIARESGGNPFFVSELVQYIEAGAQLRDDPSASSEVRLEEVLQARVGRLPASARSLLEVVSISARPLDQSVAFAAAGLGDDAGAALGVLRSGRLIRSAGSADGDRIETYHDRIREAVVAGLPATVLAEHHRRLARVLESSGGADAEVLADHFRGASWLEEAGSYYAVAAAQASRALAFNRAAALYRLALELRPREGAEGRELHTKLADALACAGRGADAAREYQRAAVGAVAAERLELQRRAAMQLLVSGHIDEGLSALRVVLEAVGMTLPRTPGRALVSLLLRRAWLRLRGIGFHSRETDQIPGPDLLKVDTCWSVSAGLSMVDWIRGADFQARGLLLALRAGEPLRIARALSVSAASLAAAGGSGRRRAARLLDVAEALAEQTQDPYANGLLRLSRGMVEFLGGRWQQARTFCDQAEEIFRSRCTGVARELATAHAFSLWSTGIVGDLPEMGRRWAILLREAQERGDRYAETNLSTYLMAAVRLTADEPELARRDLDRVMRQWSLQGFHIQHHNALMARLAINLYCGDGQAAWHTVVEHWPHYRRSFLLRVQLIRIEMSNLRARCALAALECGSDSRPLLRVAGRDARRLECEQMPWADAHARLIRAGIAAVQGNAPGAARELAAAIAGYDAAGMGLHAATARRRLGLLLGGGEGRDLVGQADIWMAARGIRNPHQSMRAHTPGFPC